MDVETDYGFNITAYDLRKLMHKDRNLFVKHRGLQGICELLRTNPDSGLVRDLEDTEQRLMYFGENVIPIRTPRKFIYFLFHSLQNKLFVVSWILCLIDVFLSFVIHENSSEFEFYISNLSIICLKQNLLMALLLFLILVFGSFLEWRTDAYFVALKKYFANESYCNVIVRGEVVQMKVKELLVGDIIVATPGDIVSIDGLLLEGTIIVSEPVGPGKFDLIRKSARSIYVFAGSKILAGTGKIITICVGVNRDIQNINFGLEAKTQSTLNARVIKLCLILSYIGSITTLIIIIFHSCAHTFIVAIEPHEFNYYYLRNIFSFLIFGNLTLLFIVPQTFFNMVYFLHAKVLTAHLKDEVMVKSTEVAEKLAFVNCICVDKTSAITTNKTTVVESYIGDMHFYGRVKNEFLSKRKVELLEDSIAINSSFGSNLVASKNINEPLKQVGYKTECALLNFLSDLEINYQIIRKNVLMKNIIKVLPVDGNRKWMTTIYQPYPERFIILTKGIAEDVFDKCKFKLDWNDTVVPMTERNINDVKIAIGKMGNNSLATIALAYRDIVLSEKPKTKGEEKVMEMITKRRFDETLVNRDLVLLAIFGLEDPLRPDIEESVYLCHTGGIIVRLFTEDSLSAARTIGIKCGIYRPWLGDYMVDGFQFKDLVYRRGVLKQGELRPIDQMAFDIIVPSLKIIAEATEEEKRLMLSGLQSRVSVQEVVAITGTSLRDAELLKQAHVGLALGINGTEVCKEASDVILFKDSFTCIVRTILKSRNIYISISKVIQSQLTMVLTIIVFCLICPFLTRSNPIKSIHLMILIFISDTFFPIMIFSEDAKLDTMFFPPFSENTSLINELIIKNILGQTFYQISVLIVIILFGPEIFLFKTGRFTEAFETSRHFSFITNFVISVNLYNQINVRRNTNQRNLLKEITRQKVFLLLFFLVGFLQILATQIGHDYIRLYPLFLEDWLFIHSLAIGCIIWQLFLTFLPSQVFFDLKFLVSRRKVRKIERFKNHLRGFGRIVPNAKIFKVILATEKELSIPDFKGGFQQ